MGLSDNVAVAALAIALVAGLVALAQVAQQYAGTAALIRKCDSIVYGPLPGKGKREFVWRQLRFKVVYSIPQISLSERLWPSTTYQSPLYSPQTRPFAPVIRKHDLQPSVGEASWVSFYKAVENSCIDELRYELLEGDADHCPAELPVVPMLVSMRDIIVLALMSGMSITDASFSRKLLLMQGNSGTISSATHPILGTMLHFTPRIVSGNHGVTVTGKISTRWIRRLYGDCPVAGTDITPFERYHIEKTEARWSKRILDYAGAGHSRYPFNKSKRSGRDTQDNTVVVHRKYSGDYHSHRVMPPAAAGPTNRHNSRRVEFTASLETREYPLELPHPILYPAPQQSVVLWRKPWPRIEMDDTVDLTRQPQGRTRHAQSLRDNDSFIFPEAPDAPSRGENFGIVILGIHDGIWSFSSKPSPLIILVSAKKHERHVASQNSRFRKMRMYAKSVGSTVGGMYRRIFPKPSQLVDEEEVLLQPAESSPHYGWEVSDFFHLDPCTIPLPAESTRVSFSKSESSYVQSLPEPIFPPDFLLYGKNISQKEGPHSVSMDRWYAAVLQQKERRAARAKEMEDLDLIKNSKPTRSKFDRRQDRKAARNGGTGPSRNNYHARFPLSLGRGFPGNQDDSTKFAEREYQDPGSVSDTPSQDHRSQNVNYRLRVIKERSPSRQAHVESADESDSWSSNSYDDSEAYSEPRINNRREVPAGANPRQALQRMGVRYGSRSDYLDNDDQSSREDTKEETDAGRKIREAQEAARRYRAQAEDETRERGAYFRDAFIREKMRQEQISEDQKEAERRQHARDERRARRIDTRYEEAARRGVVNSNRSYNDVSWFWVSQMDIIPGYFATPWSQQFSEFVAIGTVAIVLEALLGFTDKDSLQYSWAHKRDAWDWLQAEKSTFPPYARNGRGGVVITGRYQAVDFEAFEQKLPPLQLLHCYDYQVDRVPRIDDISTLNRQLELMGIDSWLSIVGRTPEISDGPANLLRTTPALVQKLMHEFGWYFEELDFYANEGGLQVIRDITKDLLDALEDESLTEAEQLFVLVALLRTAKVALSVCLGPSTELAQGLLSVDMQVHLV